jgi:hypothetical protein
VTTAERRRFEQLRDDRRTIDQAAAWLRVMAWQEQYAGLHDRGRAQMLAMLLDTLSLQLDRIPPRVRGEAVRAVVPLADRRERGT